MAVPRVLVLGTVALFAVIGVTAGVKKFLFTSKAPEVQQVAKQVPIQKRVETTRLALVPTTVAAEPLQKEGDFPEEDCIEQIFTTGPNKLPFVETITYESNVPWLKGRPAWLGDYASYYSTSRHFIARSLNKKVDYSAQKLLPGSKFNVFKKDRNFQFYLLVDLSRCKMGFYYVDLDTNERLLLKTFKVGLGKPSKTPSGSLTPIGRYLLGDKIAVYKPGIMGQFQDKQVEMIRVFGTRWVPFGKEIGQITSPAKGLGIHGSPWTTDKKGNWSEVRQMVGTYQSDGCIHMNHEDMEALFSIIITKPTVIEVVKKLQDARLPGVEVTTLMR